VDTVLVNAEIVAVTALSFLLALVVQPLLVVAVLGVARRAVRGRSAQPECDRRVAELRAIATGRKNVSRD
jgi:hypothetical protein